jgi:hypothetical protein
MLTDEELRSLQIQFHGHETQCEERWKTVFARLDDIDERIDRLLHIVLGGGATTIFFLLGLITTLLMKG